MLNNRRIVKDTNIKGSRGSGVLRVAFFNDTKRSEYRLERMRKMYINPMYKYIESTRLRPKNTKISPIPNGFLNTFPSIYASKEMIIPINIAFSGIEPFINTCKKK